jgi:DNA-binding GntR family transcriptional regulator
MTISTTISESATAGRESGNGELISSVELVYLRTRQAILSGELEPGSPLRVQDLATRNGVSMIPVREALRKLEAEGFVDSIPNRGARVAPLSLADMLDVYGVRIVLEVEALRQAFPRLTHADLERAVDLNIRMHESTDLGGAATQALHHELHFLLYRPSDSRWLLKMIQSVWDHTERYRRAMAPHVDLNDSRLQHQRIIDAIEAGDAPGALRNLELHLERSRDILAGLYTSSMESRAGGPGR